MPDSGADHLRIRPRINRARINDQGRMGVNESVIERIVISGNDYAVRSCQNFWGQQDTRKLKDMLP
jgi:hypothetical protein